MTDPVITNPSFWDKILQWKEVIFIFISFCGGLLISIGRIQAKMVTKDILEKHCSDKQGGCQEEFTKKIDEVKDLVIDLHKRQSAKIEEMDEKRERAKDDMSEKFSEIKGAIGELKGAIENIK